MPRRTGASGVRARSLFLNGLTEIRAELERGVDRHTKSIVTANIEVLLTHCMRFYDRQFITREHVNRDVPVSYTHLAGPGRLSYLL